MGTLDSRRRRLGGRLLATAADAAPSNVRRAGAALGRRVVVGGQRLRVRGGRLL